MNDEVTELGLGDEICDSCDERDDETEYFEHESEGIMCEHCAGMEGWI